MNAIHHCPANCSLEEPLVFTNPLCPFETGIMVASAHKPERHHLHSSLCEWRPREQGKNTLGMMCNTSGPDYQRDQGSCAASVVKPWSANPTFRHWICKSHEESAAPFRPWLTTVKRNLITNMPLSAQKLRNTINRIGQTLRHYSWHLNIAVKMPPDRVYSCQMATPSS